MSFFDYEFSPWRVAGDKRIVAAEAYLPYYTDSDMREWCLDHGDTMQAFGSRRRLFEVWQHQAHGQPHPCSEIWLANGDDPSEWPEDLRVREVPDV